MSAYQMQDGTVVKTENATQSWKEDCWHDGNNWISRATGAQWNHEKLYRSRKGRYWVEHTSQWQGSHPHAEWISPEEAARWLLNNGYELPEDLEALEEQVSE
jgi:hypothetical protein